MLPKRRLDNLLIVIVAAVLLVVSLVRRVYFQSQLEQKAKYNFSPVLGGMILLGFLTPLMREFGRSLIFLMTMSALVILTFIAGRNGLTKHGVLLPRLLTKILDFQNIIKVNLKPLDINQQSDVVVATFVEKKTKRQYALVFEMSLNDLISFLQQKLPSEAQIEK